MRDVYRTHRESRAFFVLALSVCLSATRDLLSLLVASTKERPERIYPLNLLLIGNVSLLNVLFEEVLEFAALIHGH